MARGDVIVLSAPSGSGKTTICRMLRSRVEELSVSVSYTTRPRKAGEEHGRDYFFVEPEVFDNMLNSREFLEHATVYGNRYGTSGKTVEEIVARGTDVLLEIDVQGGRNVKDALPEAVLVAVFPPSWEVLRERLFGRGRDSVQEMETRLRAAEEEMRILLSYDYLVVNDDLETAVTQVEQIVRAHRLRRDRSRERVDDILRSAGKDIRWQE